MGQNASSAPRSQHIQDGIPQSPPFHLDGPPLVPRLWELWVQQFSWATGQITGVAWVWPAMNQNSEERGAESSTRVEHAYPTPFTHFPWSWFRANVVLM